MTLLDILLSILILCGILLLIYLIIWLKNLEKVIKSISDDVNDIHNKAIPLIENLTETSNNASKITAEAEKRINDLSEFFGTWSEKVSWMKNKQQSLLQKKDYPGEGLLLNLRAISKGIAAFLKNI